MSVLQQPAIGIWGLGVVGWSVLRYLTRLRQLHHAGQAVAAAWPAKVPISAMLVVCEQRELSACELAQLDSLGVTVVIDVAAFLQRCTVVIPSPGVDLRPYQHAQAKFLSELDLFYAGFSKPILAITGSLGKTTVTTVISELLVKLGYRVGIGGNIGVGMCDLIAQQAELDLAVLELSSFQLAQAQQFRAQGAIWTNFYPNHLDRHSDLSDYFQAKLKLLQTQTAQNWALIPADLVASSTTKRWGPGLAGVSSDVSCFGLTRPTLGVRNLSPAKPERSWSIDNDVTPHFKRAYYLQNGFIVREQAGEITNLIAFDQLDPQIMLINWVAIVALLDRIAVTPGLKPARPSDALSLNQFTAARGALPPLPTSAVWSTVCTDYQFSGVPHRLELCYEHAGIKFYNDSKSTVPEATLAALTTLSATAPAIILLLGGLSKGVNREQLLAQLTQYPKLKAVICFGAEAVQLQQWGLKYGLPVTVSASDLMAALALVRQQAQAGDCVLFSPAGSSFDLFANYQARGEAFKQLVCREN